jgi:SAM-dependent methyltransferase
LHKTRLIYEPKYDVSGDHYVYKKADPYSSHAQIVQWIERERPAKVLEVGTATGYLTSEMVKLGCTVTGIEQDPAMAEIARQYCREMIVGDIETIDLTNLGPYDAIVFGDVLEHLRNPREVLQKMHKTLTPGGKVLMSLPNVANIWVRLNLLFGNFTYSRVGILDESHLRFFTLQTMKQLADESGLDVISINATPIPLPVILPATSRGRSLSFLHLLNWGLTKLRRTLFGYQFILVCRPKA